MRRHQHIMIPGQDPGRKIVGPQGPPGVSGRWRGPQLLVDGDMEAVGVGSWSQSGASLTKQTTNPAEGLRLLRIAATGAGAAMAYQGILTGGLTYRVTGFARSNGVATPRIHLFDTAWIGSTSTDWQPFDFLHTTGGSYITFRHHDGTPQYVEFDGVYVSVV